MFVLTEYLDVWNKLIVNIKLMEFIRLSIFVLSVTIKVYHHLHAGTVEKNTLLW